MVARDERVVAVLFSEGEEMLVVKANQKVISKDVNAGRLTFRISEMIGGQGCGQPYFGQGSGGTPEKFQASFKVIKRTLRRQLN